MTSSLEGPLSSIAFCWRIERADGAGIGLTSSDRDIMHEGVLYQSAPGIAPAAISRSLGLEADAGEVAGALSADALSEADLALGRWSAASISLVAVDWNDPGAAPVVLLAGEIGDVAVEGEGFTAELRGAAARLAKPPCPETSAECRAQLGDKHCRMDLSGRSARCSVVSSTGNLLELDRALDDRYLFGRLRFMSGANCGVISTILSVEGTQVSLRDRPRVPVTPGTIVALLEGCDKRFATCAARFANAVNFRGEPHLPGTDLLTWYPGA